MPVSVDTRILNYVVMTVKKKTLGWGLIGMVGLWCNATAHARPIDELISKNEQIGSTKIKVEKENSNTDSATKSDKSEKSEPKPTLSVRQYESETLSFADENYDYSGPAVTTGCDVSFQTLNSVWETQLSLGSESEKKSLIRSALESDRCLNYRYDFITRNGKYNLDAMVARLSSSRSSFSETEDLIENERTPIPGEESE